MADAVVVTEFSDLQSFSFLNESGADMLLKVLHMALET